MSIRLEKLNRVYKKVMKETQSDKYKYKIVLTKQGAFMVDDIIDGKYVVKNRDLGTQILLSENEVKKGIKEWDVLSKKLSELHDFMENRFWHMEYSDNDLKELEKYRKIIIEYMKAVPDNHLNSEFITRIDRNIKITKDINPLIKQLKVGMDFKKVKDIISKSKYWENNDRDFYNDLWKVRGPLDLYIKFKDNKLLKYYF